MIQMEVTICRIDDKPIQSSPAYKLARFLLGKEAADKLTYTMWLPRDEG